MSIAIGIVAHPDRLQQARDLMTWTSANVISLDDKGHGERWNHQNTLAKLLRYRADWYVLLEDDALPGADFHGHLHHYLTTAPSGIVSLYLGTGRWAGTSPPHHERVVRGLIEDADQEGAEWITTGALWHAVGVAIPRTHASSLLAHLRDSPLPTDEAITAWCRATRTPVHYTWPSLVDHHDGPTVTLHPDGQQREQPRRAWRVA